VNARFAPSGPLRGTIAPPPDKSISHRAALIGAMASEPVRIRNYLEAADTSSTLRAIRSLGTIVEERPDSELIVRGGGLRNAQPVTGGIYVGNAGTLMRLLPGWLAFQAGMSFTLDGDDSIRRRPVDRIAAPLGEMGAQVEARDGRFPPFTVHGARLQGIEYELPVASAQVKSCVLLAGLGTDGTTVIERVPSRDHTERMLLRSGAPVARECSDGLTRFTVGDTDELELDSVDIPGDLSSAAFLIAAAVLVRGSRLVLSGVGVNWTRAGFLRILDRMGAIVLGDVEPAGSFSASEPVADLDVSFGPLEGTVVDADEVPLAIDELPLVALLGCFAEGETVVRGAGELRLKESDRIATVVGGLRGLGASIEATDDGFAVTGSGSLRGGVKDAAGDHRLALLGAVAGLASEEGVEVVGMDAAGVSYPRFADDLAQLVA
jgi:3-phosphoshikimate 1-carboxyvinyltransferase